MKRAAEVLMEEFNLNEHDAEFFVSIAFAFSAIGEGEAQNIVFEFYRHATEDARDFLKYNRLPTWAVVVEPVVSPYKA